MSANPWTRRFLLAGLIGMVLGAAAVSLTWGDFERMADPTRTNVAQIDPGASVSVDLVGHEYVAYQHGEVANTTVEMRSGDTLLEMSAPNQWAGSGPRADADGQMMVAIGVWKPVEGAHTVENTGNMTVYLVDNTELNEPTTEMAMLYAGCFGLVCGLVMLPVAGIIHMLSKPKPEAPVNLVQADGAHVPTTEEVWLAMQRGESIEAPQKESEVPPPFATKVEVEVEAPIEVEVPVQESASKDWQSWDEG